MKTKPTVIVWLFIIATLFLSASTYANENGNSAITDPMIATQIGNAILASPITKATTTKVIVSNRMVTIVGVAKSNSEAEELVKIAASNPHTISVETKDLSVKDSTQPLTDSYITAKVKGIFIKNYLFDDKMNVPAFNIHVETKNGIVYLTGTTQTQAQKEKAAMLAMSVQGVKDVKSTLTVYVGNK